MNPPPPPPLRMSPTRRTTTVLLAISAMILTAGRPAAAQSLGDLAAWDALVVTPVGAFAPRVHDPLLGDSVRTELSIRYGRWRYDIDDAIHNDFGVTVARTLGAARTTISVTAAYLSLSCGDCQPWISGDVEASTRLVDGQLAGDSARNVVASASLVATAGAARFLGDGHASAGSIAGRAAFALTFPIGASRMSVTVLPGVGVGRFSSVDQDAYGTRPMLGASAAWQLPWGVVIDLGVQHVYIDGGPSQIGLGLSWER